MRVATPVFGTLRDLLEVPLAGSGSAAKVRYSDSLLFPGLRPGEQLSRTTPLPPRASLLADDGTPLAEGPDRTSPIPRCRADRRHARTDPGRPGVVVSAQGYPANAKVGQDGLERVFQQRSRASGRHAAGRPPRARARPNRCPVRPSTRRSTRRSSRRRRSDGLQSAGIAAMNPRTGAVTRSPGSPSRSPAARIDDEDDHRHGRAQRRDRPPRHRVPVRRAQRRSTATRSRTRTARSAAGPS